MGYVLLCMFCSPPRHPGIGSSSLEEPPQTEGAAASQGTLAEAEGKGVAPPQLVRAIRQSLNFMTRSLASCQLQQAPRRPQGRSQRERGEQRPAVRRVGEVRHKGESGTQPRGIEGSNETEPRRY